MSSHLGAGIVPAQVPTGTPVGPFAGKTSPEFDGGPLGACDKTRGRGAGTSI
jgi:hypothetical protein